MSSYNKVTIVGNLGQDPETKFFQNGGQLTNISVATSETWKDKTTGEKKTLTEWNRVTLNNKLSELADKYLNKGDKVLIEGKLRTRKLTDEKGVERYATEIIAREMVFLTSKNQSSQNQGSEVDRYMADKKQEQAPGPGAEDNDDLPF